MARTRARVAAMRPIHDAIRLETERARVATNFAFVEAEVTRGSEDPRYPLILHARGAAGFGWDEAVAFADGHYAARAGWEPRSGAWMAAPIAAAYDRGFRDGGGRPEDIFDTARRALVATAPMFMVPSSMPVPLRARPLPSEWPSPTEAPRPVRWPQRMLLLDAAHAETFASELQRDPASGLACVLLTDARRGFRPLDGTDQDWRSDLSIWLAGREIENILIAAEDSSFAFIDTNASMLPVCRTMARTRNSALQQRAQFRIWLARGLAGSDVRAAGHIRWGKLAKGLTGRLGEFTARYAGPHRPRGHRIIVELEPGVPAAGYRTPTGRNLEPELIISNRRHLRAEMTVLLRDFAAALRNA